MSTVAAEPAGRGHRAPAGEPPTPPGALERQLTQMLVGFWMSQAIGVAAELAIADRLAAGPRSVDDLAAESGVDGPSLYRLLRALASVGIFAEDGERRFALTGLGALLAGDAPGSLRPLALLGRSEFYQAWSGLLDAVRAGSPAFDAVYGVPFFDYLECQPARSSLYDAAMNGAHDAETIPVLDAYDFSPLRSLVDVGGGNGLTLATALRRHPRLRGVLFDLPQVAERSGKALASSDIANRIHVVGGSFFDAVPPGADAYLLRHVIHDWDDDSAALILRRCAEVMAENGRVLVVETVIPAGNGPCFGKWLDLMMLVVGGRERTLGEYERIFSAAGLRLQRVVPTAHEVSVLEGVRAR